MVIPKLKLVKGKTSYEASVAANGILPDGGVNHGTKVIEELVYPWVVKGEKERVVAAYYYFTYVQYVKSFEDMGI